MKDEELDALVDLWDDVCISLSQGLKPARDIITKMIKATIDQAQKLPVTKQNHE